MENEAVAESGDESLDSIPRPEYEALEVGAASTHSSLVADSLCAKEMEGVTPISDIRSWSGMDFEAGDVHSEDAISEVKPELTAQDLKYLDITDEKLNDHERKNVCGETFNEAFENEIQTKLTQQNIAIESMQTESTLAANPHKLVQAKTKDNKFLLVQLVDENGKTLNPPVRSVSQINKSDVPAGMPARSSTPMSREFLALQKSVNESKILTEFVTDTNVEKARKRKAVPQSKESTKIVLDFKDASKMQRKSNSSTGVNTSEHVTADSEILEKQEKAVESLTLVIKQPAEQQKVVISPPSKNVLALTATSLQKNSAEKSRKLANSKFVPLKDDASSNQSDSSVSSKRRSRSKSLSRKISANVDINAMSSKLKRWPSEEKSLKRTNMRSQNSEFVQKQMEFLHRVIGQEEENIDDDDDDANDVNEQEEEQRSTSFTGDADDVEAQLAASVNCSMNDSVKSFLGNFRANTSDTQQSPISSDGNSKTMEKYLESIYHIPPKRGWDSFCWKCRQCFELLACSKCLRSYHPTCIKITAATKLDKTWACPECVAVENVLNGPKRTRRNELSLDMLSQLLSFALKRMRNVKGLAQFEQSYKQITSSSKYFVNPVSFETLQEKIENKSYRCAEEFVNETKWMQHNTLIASAGTNSKDAITAKAIFKICRQEANEIDTCPECYLNANLRTDWFLDVCSQPHLLLWAKLKGFPYWPAKAMGLGQGSHVNVRFFGQHDRAFVPSKDCYLFSEHVPNAAGGKRSARAGFAECLQEVEVHIEKIRAKVGAFKYAPYKTLYDPAMELQQLELMMPGVQEYMKRQQLSTPPKPPLQYKIVKTADNHLSIIKKGTSTADSGTDSDHSLGIMSSVVDNVMVIPEKKKKLTEHLLLVPEMNKNVKLPATLAETNKSIKIPTTTSDYEVVSKLTNEENNSSKVSTVILKRKAENAQHRKGTDSTGEDTELPLPKMTKIENNPEEELNDEHVLENQVAEKNEQNTMLESSEHLKQKLSPPKQSKAEQKVPILTIRTNSNKIEETKAPIEVCAKVNESVPNPQNAVENLVKYKQGVTIKKIAKEDPKKKTAHESTTNERTAAIKKDTAITHQEKSVDQFEKPQHAAKKENKQKQELIQKQKAIIKDLVPFVEIKKETASDEEASQDEKDKPHVTTETEANTAVATVVVAPANTFAPPDSSQPASSNQVNASTQPLAEPMNNTTLLDSVKQEQMSDDDEEVSTLLTVLNAENVAPMQAEKKAEPAVPAAAVVSAVVPPAAIEAVRVVGDTTIQRVSIKMASIATSYFGNQSNTTQTRNSPPDSATTSIPQTGSMFTGLPQMSAATTSSTNNSKRNTMRGIPYGPLPASAAPTVRALANFEHINIPSTPLDKQQLQQPQAQQLSQQFQQHKMQRPEQQRARKSFPNRSPTEVSPVRGVVVTPPISPATAVVNIADPKRALTKTSMVSIPVDVATSRCNITAGIPVPPLTAVTKTMPTTITSTVSTVTTTTAAAAPITTYINCNGSTQITMSAPPPLAGLSYSTLTSTSSTTTLTSTSSVQMLNGNVPSSLSDSPVAGNSNNNQHMEPHLLGDFVTPTLASAITEVICRGPPRMTPRPNGPLQSDGSTMFPSQAGPVCRTLVENAHKLTDFFISVMEDTMSEMSVSEEPVLQAKITLLTMELERTKQTYEREITELKRTSDLMLCEMRKSMESEKNRIAAEVRKQCELERKRCVEETKKKQWCANCGRESQFHCCWNTSYCDYPCQQLHWSRHAASCAQTRPLSHDPALQSTSGSAATPMERHHASNKSFATITSTSSSHYNNKILANTKRDKTSAKSASNNAANTLTNAAAVAPAEVLKLPSNTYLRPVTSSTSVRTAYPQQAPVQRFNIPLPIAAPANPGLPYTLVQREGNWELMSALTHTGTATNSATLATNTCQATAINQQQQTRLLSNPNTLTTKSVTRNRSVNTTTLSANLSGSTHRSGAHL